MQLRKLGLALFALLPAIALGGCPGPDETATISGPQTNELNLGVPGKPNEAFQLRTTEITFQDGSTHNVSWGREIDRRTGKPIKGGFQYSFASNDESAEWKMVNVLTNLAGAGLISYSNIRAARIISGAAGNTFVNNNNSNSSSKAFSTSTSLSSLFAKFKN